MVQLLLQTLPQLIAALIGGGVAGHFAMRGVKQAIDADREAAQIAEKSRVKGVLTALYDEMDVVWKRYLETMGRQLESLPEGQPLLSYYPVINDYFTFYSANAALIGRIPDSALRSSIVRTYTLGKGLIDSFRMNNSMLQDLESLQVPVRQPADGIILKKQQDLNGQLVQYAGALKVTHAEVKEAVDTLLTMLRRELGNPLN